MIQNEQELIYLSKCDIQIVLKNNHCVTLLTIFRLLGDAGKLDVGALTKVCQEC